MIPLIDKDQDKAIRLATEVINTFEKEYEEKWLSMMRNKLGLLGTDDSDKSLILDLLAWMHQNKVDYTNTFCHLMNLKTKKDNNYEVNDFHNWKKRWQERLMSKNNSTEKYTNLMKKVNPLVIPRNHNIEEVLKEGIQGNLKPFNHFLNILKNPYTNQKNISEYQTPADFNKNYQTFCGT